MDADDDTLSIVDEAYDDEFDVPAEDDKNEASGTGLVVCEDGSLLIVFYDPADPDLFSGFGINKTEAAHLAGMLEAVLL